MSEADKIIESLKNFGKKVEEFYVSNKTSDKNVATDNVIAHKFATMQQQIDKKDKRIKELEEENMKLKAQHIFTKRNSTVEEKAKIFDVIDRTVDTFLEKEKLLWEQKFKANKMSVEEATDIVNEMYQERMKSISEDENTVNVDKLDDVKFTNLEFASVRLLREVQSLQRKLVNSIPKQKVIDKIKELKLSGGSDGKDNVENLVRELTIDILQELLEGGSK